MNQKRNARITELLELERLKKEANVDLDTAKADLERAKEKKNQAQLDLEYALNKKEDWETACIVSLVFIIPALISCPVYATAITDNAEFALFEYESRVDTAERKLTTAEALEEKLEKYRVELEWTEKMQTFYHGIRTKLSLKILKQKVILKDLGRLQGTIQEFKNEVDMVQARTQSVEGIFKVM